jgi:enoyl-CoA hydratase
LTLSRPEVLNALSVKLIDELSIQIISLSYYTDVREIILTGEGRAFCAGVDLKELAGEDNAAGHLEWHSANSLMDIMRACPHPIIGAINGFAITGGLELALWCDFLIAAQSAQLGDTHARVDITPSWGLTQLLPRVIGLRRAKQMSLTGDLIDAQTAEAWGLVNRVTTDDNLLVCAWNLATQITQSDVETMSKIKTLIDASQNSSLDEGLKQEVEVFDRHIEGVSISRLEIPRS